MGLTIIGHDAQGNPIFGESTTVNGTTTPGAVGVPWYWQGDIPSDSGGGATTGTGGYTPPTTDPNAPPAANTPQKPNVSGGGGGLLDTILKLLGIIKTGAGIYGAAQGNHYRQYQDPLTDALRARMYGFIDNSPTRNMLGNALQSYVTSGNKQQMPNVPNKYNYDPYPNGVPKYDLSSMIPWIQSTTSPQHPTTPQAQPPPDYTTPDMRPTSGY